MPDEFKIDIKAISQAYGIQKEVVEVYGILKRYGEASARRKWLKRREDAWKAIENDMVPSKDEVAATNEGMEILVRNHCNEGVQGSAAIVTAQRPELKFLPRGSRDLYLAELLKRAHDVNWDKNNGTDVVYDFVEEAKIGGIGFISAFHDPNKGFNGKNTFEEEPPDDIYWDPNARKRDLSDTHIIKAKLRSKKYIKDRYEGVTDEDLNFDPVAPDDQGESFGTTGKDDYAEQEAGRIEEDKPLNAKGWEQEEPKTIWEIDAWLIKVEKIERVVIINEENGDITAKPFVAVKDKKPEEVAEGMGGKYVKQVVEKRVRRIIVGKKLVSEETNPHGVDADGCPILGLIPVREQRTRNAYPMSPTNYALPINQDLIKRYAQFSLNISHNVNSPIVEPENAVTWVNGSPGTPGSRAKVAANAAFQPKRLESGSFQAGHFLELAQIDNDDIRSQYNWHEVMQGKVPKNQENMSGRAVLALQDKGDLRSKPFLRNLESALVRLAFIDIALDLKYWRRERWERLIEDDELTSWIPEEEKNPEEEQGPGGIDPETQQKINQRWLEALDMVCPEDGSGPKLDMMNVDIKIVAGSSMPTNRMAKMDVAIELKREGIYDARAALDYIDDPQKDKILPRIQKLELMAAQAGKTRR